MNHDFKKSRLMPHSMCFLMDSQSEIILQQNAAKRSNSLILRSTDQRDIDPLIPLEVNSQDESALSVSSMSEVNKGVFTSSLGGVGFLGGIWISYLVYSAGETAFAVQVIVFSLLLLVIPFVWEVFSKVDSPLLFNRRTREVYYQKGGVLYHAEWDAIGGITYEHKLIHQNVGVVNNAPLEIIMHRFGSPDDRIFVPVGSPMGKSLELQKQFWAYLQAYMDKGPWLDEKGESADSPENVQNLIKSNQVKRRDEIKYIWRNWIELRGPGELFQVVFAAITYPLSVIWDFTHFIAIRRSHSTWPPEVLERLRPDGPVTRLVDIEKSKSKPPT